MKGVLYVRDRGGNFVPIMALKGEKGADGESPYSVAKANGYTGTEEELNKAVAELVETNSLVKGVQTHINSHSNKKDNPHGVTAAQVGAATMDDVENAVKDKAPMHSKGQYDLEAGVTPLEDNKVHYVYE